MGNAWHHVGSDSFTPVALISHNLSMTGPVGGGTVGKASDDNVMEGRMVRGRQA